MPSNAYSSGCASACGDSSGPAHARGKRRVRGALDAGRDSGENARGRDDAGGRLGQESATAGGPALGQSGAGNVRDAGVEQSVRRDQALELPANAGHHGRIGNQHPRARRGRKSAQDHREVEAEHGVVAPIVGGLEQVHAGCRRVGCREPGREPGLHGGSAIGERRRISESLCAPREPLQIIAGNFRVDIERRPGDGNTTGHAAGIAAGAHLRRTAQQPVRDGVVGTFAYRCRASGGRQARAHCGLPLRCALRYSRSGRPFARMENLRAARSGIRARGGPSRG